MKQLAKVLIREKVALEALEVAIIQLKPFYGKPDGSGAIFIKEFIDGLIDRTPVEIHRVYCLDLENFRAIQAVLEAVSCRAGDMRLILIEKFRRADHE